MRSETRKFDRGYVRATWYNARRVARLNAREPYRGTPYPAPTPAETLADILRNPYIRERSTANRCAHCGALQSEN